MVASAALRSWLRWLRTRTRLGNAMARHTHISPTSVGSSGGRCACFFLEWQIELKLGYDTDTMNRATPGGIGYGTYHPPPRPYGNADLEATPALLPDLWRDSVGRLP